MVIATISSIITTSSPPTIPSPMERDKESLAFCIGGIGGEVALAITVDETTVGVVIGRIVVGVINERTDVDIIGDSIAIDEVYMEEEVAVDCVVGMLDTQGHSGELSLQFLPFPHKSFPLPLPLMKLDTA